MRKLYVVCKPLSEGSLKEEWGQCLKQLLKSCSEGRRPVKFNIFIELPGSSSYQDIRKEISDSLTGSFLNACPSFNVTVNPPEKPWKVVTEALFVVPGKEVITTNYYGTIPYVVAESEHTKEIWCSGMGSEFTGPDTRNAACFAFEQMAAVLEKEGMSLNEIVRQWNFIGNILKINEGLQNYQVFNEVRGEYYHKYRTLRSYPAATGVGMDHEGVIIDFYAVKSDAKMEIRPVDNPNQARAYEYGQDVLKGLADPVIKVKQPPQFERALLLNKGEYTAYFISGTASIIGQEVIGRNNVREQVNITNENIKKLTDPLFICNVMGENLSFSSRFLLIRVYIRHTDDFEVVKSICTSQYPDIPAVYIRADICRDELLAEIEAELLLSF